jgi:hypothetical protein
MSLGKQLQQTLIFTSASSVYKTFPTSQQKKRACKTLSNAAATQKKRITKFHSIKPSLIGWKLISQAENHYAK